MRAIRGDSSLSKFCLAHWTEFVWNALHKQCCLAGTDEHGLKIQQAAESVQKQPLAFCSEVSEKFKHLFTKSNISYTDFIRTTESRHRSAVEHFWTVLLKKGLIYKGSYEGWYSTQDESFLTPTQVTKVTDANGNEITISTESGHKVRFVSHLLWPYHHHHMKREVFIITYTHPHHSYNLFVHEITIANHNLCTCPPEICYLQITVFRH